MCIRDRDDVDPDLGQGVDRILGRAGNSGDLETAVEFQLSLIHISEPTRLLSISYAVFCLKKKKKLLKYFFFFFFLMIRRPPRSTLDRSSAASDVYKRQSSAVPATAAISKPPSNS